MITLIWNVPDDRGRSGGEDLSCFEIFIDLEILGVVKVASALVQRLSSLKEDLQGVVAKPRVYHQRRPLTSLVIHGLISHAYLHLYSIRTS